MLNYLKLTNYRKHQALELTFTEGLNGLRGANEQGKSTVYEAITYAFGGARALPEAVADVVTWGSPVNSLKVELGFTDGTTQFVITRGPTGAELNAPGLKVTGQSEVTGYVERLLGLPINLAKQVMIVEQGAIRGVLESGAVPMIEQLAKADLVDDLVNLVLQKLPCGNTKMVEANISRLDQRIAEVPVAPNLEEFNLKLHSLNAYALGKELELNTVETQQAIAKANAVQAKAELATVLQLGSEQANLEKRLATLKAVAEPIKPVVNIDELVAKQAAQESAAEAQSAWRVFNAAYSGPSYKVSDLNATIGAEQAEANRVIKQMNDYQIEVATLRAGIITAETCNLCGKNLSSVEEVQTSNSNLQSRINDLVAEIAKLEIVHKAHIAAVQEAEALVMQYRTTMACFRYPKYIQFTEDWLTPVTWIGPAVSSEKDTANYPALISAATKANAEYLKLRAAWESAINETAGIQSRLTELASLLIDKRSQSELNAVITKVEELSGQALKLQRELSAIRAEESAVLQQKSVAIATYDAQQAAWQALQADREAALADLNALRKNNALLERLRAIRPQLARRLWTLVLGAVSSHFSRMRGAPSIITLEDGQFKVDGKSYKSYSGSTQDILGLAIRIVIQKTFLPNASFMILDEPAAGCDADREAALLANLVLSGFKQTIVVSHSDLLDTYASDMMQI